MYYLVNVDLNSMAVHLTTSDCEGFFKKCCISNAMGGTDDDDTLWDGCEEDGNVRSECEEEKALTEDGDSDTDW
jgi:hypothetical protein